MLLASRDQEVHLKPLLRIPNSHTVKFGRDAKPVLITADYINNDRIYNRIQETHIVSLILESTCTSKQA